MTVDRQRSEHCYLGEKALPSVGIVHFIRDFVCRLNTSCYNETEINWNDVSTNVFLPFFEDLTNIYAALPTAPYSLIGIWWWDLGGYQTRRIQRTMEYFKTNIQPIFTILGQVSSENQTEADEGMAYFCRSAKNDLGSVSKLFAANKTKSKFPTEPKSCQALFYARMKNDLVSRETYKVISPLLFGKIFYAPDSPFTRRIMRKANTTFVLIDNIRRAAIQWRTTYRFQLENGLRYNYKVQSLRSVARSCIYWSPANSKQCQRILDLLNMDTIMPMIHSATEFFYLVEDTLNCSVLDKFTPLNSSKEIDELEDTPMTNIFAAVVFDESFQYLTEQNATLLKYAIRMSTNRIDPTESFKVLDKFWTPFPRVDISGHLRYYTSGFLFLQEAIDHAFIELVTEKRVPFGSSIQIMPYPCHLNDTLGTNLPNLLPFLLIIGWAPSFMVLLQNIVHEKERKLKQFMYIMGLSSHANWMSRLVFTMTVQIGPIIIMSAILKFGKIFYFSSFFIIFTVLISFVISFICQAFMISVFFDNANLATVSGGIFYFVFYLPFLVFVNFERDLTIDLYYGWRLFSQVSFCNAINFLLYWEQSVHGVEFTKIIALTKVDLYFEIWHCIFIMWVDSLICIFVTWYVGNVFPGRYGIPKPWYFIFTKQISFSCKTGFHFADAYPVKHIEPISAYGNPETKYYFEDEPVHLDVSISIQRLVKKFARDNHPVVNDLNLNIYKSHITSILGHNGAGKTTIVSIIAGLIPPTSGTALILNLDIRKNIKQITKNMGFCPQRSILFHNLTVRNHIYFYGLLHGLSRRYIRSMIPQLLRNVGLASHWNTLEKQLSYGFKRKLSIAIAFIGNSQIVILDEPTVGVDPVARKQIWDVILNYRTADKTIILITQDMDEADYLSDRVAIIANGVLKCCGSPAFLKRRYGIGYNLILYKNPNLSYSYAEHNVVSTEGSKILNYVKRFMDSAIFIEETNRQWKIVFPYSKLNTNKLSIFLKDLDVSFGNLKIFTYSLSDTSLEDVFLKVLDDPTIRTDNDDAGLNNLKTLDFMTNYYNHIPSDSILSSNDKAVFSEIDILNYQTLEVVLKYDTISGFPLLLQQIWGLVIKRFHYTKRDYKAFMAEIFLPNFLILLMIILLKTSTPQNYQPPMIISPWLMMKTANMTLNTFIRKETDTRPFSKKLYETYKTDMGESGIRCMNSSIFQLKDFPCNFSHVGLWKKTNSIPILMHTPDCNCNVSGYQYCADNRSGGPPPPYRIMISTDRLHDLSGYNLSDYLIKNFKLYIGTQYGGYQLMFISFIGETFKRIGELDIWIGFRSVTDEYSRWFDDTFLNLLQRTCDILGHKEMYVRVWVNSKGYISMPTYINMLSNVALRSQFRPDIRNNYGIVIENHPFRVKDVDLYNQAAKILFLEVTLDIFVILGMSFIPASFVIFLIEERVSGFRQQQFVSGVNPYIYWISTFFWDIMKYIVSVLLVLITFIIFKYFSLTGFKNIGAFSLLLVFYGLAMIPHMYPFSFIFTNPSTAFVVLYIYNLLVGSVTTMLTFAADQLTDSSFTSQNNVLKRIFLIFPQYCLGRGMLDLSVNYMTYDFSDKNIDYDPYAQNTTAEKLYALILASLFSWFVMFLLVSGIIGRLLFRLIAICNLLDRSTLGTFYSNITNMFSKEFDDMSENRNILQLIDLTKIYWHRFSNRKTVVDKICIDINRGACLSLVGPNACGKTTIFKMLTGEESITSGEALINRISFVHHKIHAHRFIGFCPQIEAYPPLLTSEELLYFYCRIRGVQKWNMKFTVTLVLKNFSFLSQSDKCAYTLSGGNKRKLSTAIALIGFPDLLVLDDPTSCMDVASKHIVWNIIQRANEKGKRAVFMASHNMNECEIVCNEIAIMLNGEIKCIENINDLKVRYGNDYYAKIRLHPSRDRMIEKIKLKIVIKERFPQTGILNDENSVELTFRFSAVKLYKIFDFFEEQKKKHIIFDYSISQMSLDNVFKDFAQYNSTSAKRTLLTFL